MIEIEKQISIFGDFDRIDFENIVNDLVFYTKLGFSVQGAPDLPNIILTGNIATIQNQNDIKIRPMLVNKDKSIKITIGTKRINIDHFSIVNDDFYRFIEVSKKVIEHLLSVFDNLKVNRLALNGKIIDDWNNQKSNIFSLFFIAPSDMNTINNYMFQIERVEEDKKTGLRLNKIQNASRVALNVPTMENKDSILLGYDFNTVEAPNITYRINDFFSFIVLAEKFRNDTMNLVKRNVSK